MENREQELHPEVTPLTEESRMGSEGRAGGTPPEKKPFSLDKEKKIRLFVSFLAAAITLTFFALSYRYFSVMVMSVVFVISVSICALAFVSIFRGWDTAYKLSITALYVGAICLIVYFVLNKSGLLRSIDSADDIVEYINHSGGVAEVIFVAVNFLQVTIIPIPSTITTTAGAILFEGIWKPLYLTVIGLVTGSMFAFFLGRVFGVRFANWLVGEKIIARYKAMTKGRDKVVLFYMFIFPFFPDDFLCILAGMTNYTYLGFFFLQVFSRTIGTLTTILITKGIVSIPFYGWWLVLWAAIIILVIVLLIYTIKYSDKIEIFVLKIIDKLTFGLFKKKIEQELHEDEATPGKDGAPNADDEGENPPSDEGDNNVSEEY